MAITLLAINYVIFIHFYNYNLYPQPLLMGAISNLNEYVKTILHVIKLI